VCAWQALAIWRVCLSYGLDSEAAPSLLLRMLSHPALSSAGVSTAAEASEGVALFAVLEALCWNRVDVEGQLNAVRCGCWLELFAVPYLRACVSSPRVLAAVRV
jgi:hypothetical protein